MRLRIRTASKINTSSDCTDLMSSSRIDGVPGPDTAAVELLTSCLPGNEWRKARGPDVCTS